MPSPSKLLAAIALVLSAGGSVTTQQRSGPVFSIIAGEWGFAEIDECATNSRIFSFHKNRKILRATHQEISEAGHGDLRKVFEYDILNVSPHELHVSLRGETRLDSAGQPVTWYLVVFDNDTLRWRQSNWKAGEFTSELVRCKT
jgi:hypothetical protein